VSLLTRKQETGTGAMAQARQAASQLGPMAANASRAARSGAEEAKTRVTPHVHRARSWAAPRVASAGLAVRDSIGPKVSDALVNAAQRLDYPAPARRRWPKVLAGLAMLAAAASAVAAIAFRRQLGIASYGTAGPAAGDGTAGDGSAAGHTPEDASDQAEPGVDRQVRTP
jgi:hypothetical protein